jgi:hypothetical protein
MPYKPKLRHLVLIVSLVLLDAGCAAPLYDEQTDKEITALQREIDSRLVALITLSRSHDKNSAEKASYAQNSDFYDKVESDLTILRTRMLASADRSAAKLAPVFDNLAASIADLRKVHEMQGRLGAVALVATRNQLNAQFSILLTYELSLKSGAGATP